MHIEGLFLKIQQIKQCEPAPSSDETRFGRKKRSNSVDDRRVGNYKNEALADSTKSPADVLSEFDSSDYSQGEVEPTRQSLIPPRV